MTLKLASSWPGPPAVTVNHAWHAARHGVGPECGPVTVAAGPRSAPRRPVPRDDPPPPLRRPRASRERVAAAGPGPGRVRRRRRDRVARFTVGGPLGRSTRARAAAASGQGPRARTVAALAVRCTGGGVRVTVGLVSSWSVRARARRSGTVTRPPGRHGVTTGASGASLRIYESLAHIERGPGRGTGRGPRERTRQCFAVK